MIPVLGKTKMVLSRPSHTEGSSVFLWQHASWIDTNCAWYWGVLVFLGCIYTRMGTSPYWNLKVMIGLQCHEYITVFIVVECFEEFGLVEIKCIFFYWEWFGEVGKGAVIDSSRCIMMGLTIKIVLSYREKKDLQWIIRLISFNT